MGNEMLIRGKEREVSILSAYHIKRKESEIKNPSLSTKSSYTNASIHPHLFSK